MHIISETNKKTAHHLSSTSQPNRLTFPLMMSLVGGNSGTSTETPAIMYLSGCNGNKYNSRAFTLEISGPGCSKAD